MEIMWGLTIWTVRSTASTELVWLHGLHIDATATARDLSSSSAPPPLHDSFDFDIPVPLRMHPGGTITEAWRPDIVDFENPMYHRPTITGMAIFSWSAKVPAASEPLPVQIIDRFAFDGVRYVLAKSTVAPDEGQD